MDSPSVARGMVASFSEAIAKMIESFGTMVLSLVIAVVVGQWTHSWGWGVGIAIFGIVGSVLSMYYRSKAEIDSTPIPVKTRRPERGGASRLLESDLEVSDDVRQADAWLRRKE
ncbi:hypothetical protein [Ferrimicrobium sp.]|uniref:hypothetical protein n=1 Tax=Ferrimicrobium sp. TaxID=2926050 RepID=UPI00260733BC|nr:hypothetical protein [Ferrimicrobium sp.]